MGERKVLEGWSFELLHGKPKWVQEALEDGRLEYRKGYFPCLIITATGDQVWPGYYLIRCPNGELRGCHRDNFVEAYSEILPATRERQ